MFFNSKISWENLTSPLWIKGLKAQGVDFEYDIGGLALERRERIR
jgi:hypothetical protein